jgi:two-component system, NarL family, invasion response regulator UvrY
MISVMIVDDHAMFREGVKRVFSDSEDIRVTHEAMGVSDFRTSLEAGLCDVVLLDLKLGDGNGLDLIQVAKKIHSEIQVVVLSALDHVRYVMLAMQEGADGYVVKGTDFSELAHAIRTVSKGEKFICSAVSPQLLDSLISRSQGAGIDGLSEQEFRVLVLSSAGLSLKEIGEDLSISEKTVSTYRSRMMGKLKLRSMADLVRYAMRHGLVD